MFAEGRVPRDFSSTNAVIQDRIVATRIVSKHVNTDTANIGLLTAGSLNIDDLVVAQSITADTADFKTLQAENITSSGLITSTGGDITAPNGTVSADTVVCTTLQAGNVNFDNISTDSLTCSGLITSTGGDITAPNGTILGEFVTASDTVSGVSVTASGTVSGVSITASGTVTGATVTSTGNFTTSTGNFMTTSGLFSTGLSSWSGPALELNGANAQMSINGIDDANLIFSGNFQQIQFNSPNIGQIVFNDGDILLGLQDALNGLEMKNGTSIAIANTGTISTANGNIFITGSGKFVAGDGLPNQSSLESNSLDITAPNASINLSGTGSGGTATLLIESNGAVDSNINLDGKIFLSTNPSINGLQLNGGAGIVINDGGTITAGGGNFITLELPSSVTTPTVGSVLVVQSVSGNIATVGWEFPAF